MYAFSFRWCPEKHQWPNNLLLIRTSNPRRDWRRRFIVVIHVEYRLNLHYITVRLFNQLKPSSWLFQFFLLVHLPFRPSFLLVWSMFCWSLVCILSDRVKLTVVFFAHLHNLAQEIQLLSLAIFDAQIF